MIYLSAYINLYKVKQDKRNIARGVEERYGEKGKVLGKRNFTSILKKDIKILFFNTFSVSNLKRDN